LRVLVLGSYPALDPRHGGQIRLAQILAAFRARGVQVKQASFFPAHDFYTKAAMGSADIALPVAQLQSWRGRPVPLVEDLVSGELVAADPARLEALERFSGPVDIVDLEHPWLLPVVDQLRERGKLGPFKLVYGSHNIEHSLKRSILAQYNVADADDVVQAILELEQRSAREAVLVGAVTEEDARQLRQWTNAPVVVAPNGVSAWSSSEEDRARWRRRLGDAPFALYVASAHPPNISGFCDSFGECLAALSPVQKVVLAGSVGEHIVKTRWYERWAPLNDRRTVVAGVLGDAELSALRDLAHTFILPMTSGGGSNLKTAEALYSGRRVVATPVALRGFEPFADLPGLEVAEPGVPFAKAVAQSLREPAVPADPTSTRRRQSLTWAHTLAPLCDAFVALERA